MIYVVARAIINMRRTLASEFSNRIINPCTAAIPEDSENATIKHSIKNSHSSNTARQLGTQSFYAFLGNVFTLAVGLPLQIYVARVIGTVGLGIYGLIDGAIFTANGFLNFGLAPTAVRFIPAHLERREYGAVRQLLRLGAAILISVGVIFYGVSLIALPYVVKFWPEVADYRHVVASMALLLPLGLLAFFLQQGLRGFQEIRYMVFGSSVLQLGVKASATVAAFAIGLRLEGYVFATILGNFVAVCWMAWGLKRKLDEFPNDTSKPFASPFPEWRRYATISYTMSLLSAAAARLDRFMLGAFVGSSAVGVLLVVNQLQQLPQIFNQMLLMVGAPMFAAVHSRSASAERDHIYALMTDWAVKASLPLVLFLMLFAYPVLALFGPEFAERGDGILRLLLFGQTINLATGPIGSLALMSGLEHIFLRLAAANTIVMAVLTVILAVPFGLLGVAVATVASTVFINISVMIVVRRKRGLRWWNRRFFGWFAPAAVSGGVGAAILYAGVALGAVSLFAILLAMYGSFVIALFIQGLHDDERDLLRDIAKRFLPALGK